MDETTHLRLDGSDATVDGRLPDVSAPVAPAPPLPALPAAPGRSSRLRRSRTDRMVAGVCGGVAAGLGVDAALLRIALVALTLLGVGTGVVLYLAVWLLAPVED